MHSLELKHVFAIVGEYIEDVVLIGEYFLSGDKHKEKFLDVRFNPFRDIFLILFKYF
jgi:hypothetical protein